MSIRNKLLLLLALLVAVTAGNFAVLQWSNRDLRELVEDARISNELIVSLASLRYLTLEYVQRPSERTRAQWAKRYEAAERRLEEAHQVSAGADRLAVEGMRQNLVYLGQFFREITDDAPAAGAEFEAGSPAREHRDRLTRQMLARVQDMISEGQRLMRKNHESTASFVERRLSLILVSELFLIISIVLLVISIFYSVLQPLDRLVVSARKVADGDLSVKLPVHSAAEFGQINATFNDMVEKLESSIRELQTANTALLNSNQDLSRFAYVASHDLQTPLRSIAGFLQLLEADYGQAIGTEGHEWLRRALQSTSILQEIISDLLAYSRIDSATEPLEPVPLEPVVQSVMVLLDAPIRESGARIETGELPTVSGDRAQLVQLFQNLINNAIKFRCDAPPVVRIGSTLTADTVQVSVADNGIGIAPQFQDKVFEIFQRLHKQSKYPGNGIGLTVCQRIMQRHGGRIAVQSDGKNGSTFLLDFPRDPAVPST
ncbi:MAG: ATP-binding protein [Burkholderiales bacterium]|nr:ATP-binding protein [Burkholderiales bacterium]